MEQTVMLNVSTEERDNGEVRISPLPVGDIKEMLKQGGVVERVTSRYPDFYIDGLTGYADFEEMPVPGPLVRSRLHLYTLKGVRPVPLQLLSKIVFSGGIFYNIDERMNRGLEESVKFQFEQMRFLNACGLPIPLVIGYKSKREDKINCHHLVTEYWPGPTHDLSILALNEAEALLRQSSIPKGEIDIHRAVIENEKKAIIMSGIDTIRAFHLHGTGETRRPVNEGFLSGLPVSDVEDYHLRNRGVYYLKWILHGLNPEREDENDAELYDRFTDTFRRLLKPFEHKGKRYFAQGDEFLHHFKFLRNNGERGSGLFDFDRNVLTHPAYSYAKLITTYLLKLNLGDEIKFLNYAFFPNNSNERYDRKIFTAHEVMRDYLLISIASRFYDIGKRFFDKQLNVEREEENSLRGWNFPSEHRIRFPVKRHVPLSVKYPRVDKAIELQKKALMERFNKIEGESYGLSHDEMAAVSKFRDFLVDIGLYS